MNFDTGRWGGGIIDREGYWWLSNVENYTHSHPGQFSTDFVPWARTFCFVIWVLQTLQDRWFPCSMLKDESRVNIPLDRVKILRDPGQSINHVMIDWLIDCRSVPYYSVSLKKGREQCQGLTPEKEEITINHLLTVPSFETINMIKQRNFTVYHICIVVAKRFANVYLCVLM